MRLLQSNSTGEIRLASFPFGKVPAYAILSHTWGAEEVTFKDITDGTGIYKQGHNKIRLCGEQAKRDGLQYFWVDTCCIDKSNNTELQESINRMFQWYRSAAKCYAYLADVAHEAPGDRQSSQHKWEAAFRSSRWFLRGWTLQELVAPASVEFFSAEWTRLGDKTSLEPLIHAITGIPTTALAGFYPSAFSVSERMAWAKGRETTKEEDKAYSLFGIFDIMIPLLYGEGEERAFKRLNEEIEKAGSVKMYSSASTGKVSEEQEKDANCLADLRSTDPRDDKSRIEDTKGGLLTDSYSWILDNEDFQQWVNEQQGQLLWIKGDPGKGKTMLLCGVINELSNSTRLKNPTAGPLLSYFFCQGTDSRINSAASVLRGLIYMLIEQQPTLITHVRRKYDLAGKQLFEDVNAWTALKYIFNDILKDPAFKCAYLIIDALDECVSNLDQLLDLIQNLGAHARIKCLVSSRNWPRIEKGLSGASQKVRLSLELNEGSVSAAVEAYVKLKVAWLADRNYYDDATKDAVQSYLSLHAKGTFLWVALVCKELSDISGWEVESYLTAFPPGLEAIYQRMMDQICSAKHAKLCKSILAVVSVVHRPITLHELTSLVDLPPRSSGNRKMLADILGHCGSFLTLREDSIFFVHQSAKDYLLNQASEELFPLGIGNVHRMIFSRSLQIMTVTLRRDMYNLRAPGFPIQQVKRPDPDPLAPASYSCVYWVEHLHASGESQELQRDVIDFFDQKYLYWLEALSLLGCMSDGALAMAKLEGIFRNGIPELVNIIRDARRFIRYCMEIVGTHPLQTYVSALVFCPTDRFVRARFLKDEPPWMMSTPKIERHYNACLQTFENHCGAVYSVAWSPDDTRIASGSDDGRVRIWNVETGQCEANIEAHFDQITSVAWSPDSTRVASASYDKMVRIWGLNGQCEKTLKGHEAQVESVAWSPDGTRIASASQDTNVMIWNLSTRHCTICTSHTDAFGAAAWSPDNILIAAATHNETVQVWDTGTGQLQTTLDGHTGGVTSIAWSPDGTLIATGSYDETIKIWNASGHCQATLAGHTDYVSSVAWSPDGTRIASGSDDRTVKIWKPEGPCETSLSGHNGSVHSVAWSPDCVRVVSGAADEAVKIWDLSEVSDDWVVPQEILEGQYQEIISVAWSPDNTRVTSTSVNRMVKVWDLAGHCITTLAGHSKMIESVAWSPDGCHIATASWDTTVKIWNLSGECRNTLRGHTGRVTSASWSPDGTQIVSVSDDIRVKIWDFETGQCQVTFFGGAEWATQACWSPYGSRIAALSHNAINVWDTAGRLITVFTCEGNRGVCIAWAPDSTRIAAVSANADMMVCDIGRPPGAWCRGMRVRYPAERLQSVVWSPDGYRIAAVTTEGNVQLWDLTSGTETILKTGSWGPILFPTPTELQTGSGLFELLVSRSSAASAFTPGGWALSARAVGYGLSRSGKWITYQGQNIVWLPAEYRPRAADIRGTTVVIGTFSGQVLFFIFSESTPTLLYP